MRCKLSTTPPGQAEVDCVAVGILAPDTLLPAAAELDKKTGGLIREALDAGDISGNAGSFLLLRNPPRIKGKRLLLFGCGKKAALTEKAFIGLVEQLLQQLDKTGAKNALLCLADLPVAGRDDAWKLKIATQTLLTRRHEIRALKKHKPKRPKLTVIQFQFLDREPEANRTPPRKALQLGEAVAKGINFARELADLPANVCTPSYLAERALELGAQENTRVEVLDESDMEKLGMGALLSVSRGSRQPAKLIILEYRGNDREKPVALVGKGLTFDAGGISLKPAAGMDEMKYDMCGAAAVLGVFQAVIALRLPIHLVGVVPCSENLPDGAANKPGDVVTSMSGQTIEILNTDAEGRLLLCDALTYCARYAPRVVIDIATLTGACVIALGNHASGLMANQDELAEQLLAAGQESYDRAWRLPLWEEYREQLKSNFADLPNVAGREAGTITAACFLARFTEKYHWAHLDIAGTAWTSGKNKGATGRPVALLTQFLYQQSSA